MWNHINRWRDHWQGWNFYPGRVRPDCHLQVPSFLREYETLSESKFHRYFLYVDKWQVSGIITCLDGHRSWVLIYKSFLIFLFSLDLFCSVLSYPFLSQSCFFLSVCIGSPTHTLFKLTLNFLFPSIVSPVSAFCSQFPCSSFLPHSWSWLHAQPLQISTVSSHPASHHLAYLGSFFQSFLSSSQVSLTLLTLSLGCSAIPPSSVSVQTGFSSDLLAFVTTSSSQQCLKVTYVLALILPCGFLSSQQEFLHLCLCFVLAHLTDFHIVIPYWFYITVSLPKQFPISFSF